STARRVVEQAAGAQVRLARRALRIERLPGVPDLHLRRAAQIDAAVGLGNGLVFDVQRYIAHLLVGRRVGTVPVVDQLTVLDGPALWEIGSLLREVGCLLLIG